ncbi:MAG: hypothetical protein P8144_10270 [Gammaproteobacteria bacterium]
MPAFLLFRQARLKLTKLAGMLIALTALAACATFVVPDSPPIHTRKPIAVVPLKNFSQTPLAADKTEQALLTQLLKQGIPTVAPPRQTSLALEDILDSTQREKATQHRLAQRHADYILSGSVNEWGYSKGVSGDPSVSITLWLSHAETPDTILWRATGSRVGLGYKNISALAQDVLKQLIEGIHFEPY